MEFRCDAAMLPPFEDGLGTCDVVFVKPSARGVRPLFRLFSSATYKPQSLHVRALRCNLDIPEKDPKKIHGMCSVLRMLILALVTEFFWYVFYIRTYYIVSILHR